MDCFAEPVIGRRFAPTRWLAMTGLACSPVIETKKSRYGRHPEVLAALAASLEGWMSGLWPSFETRAKARSSG
jgi:hypothetical protein